MDYSYIYFVIKLHNAVGMFGMKSILWYVLSLCLFQQKKTCCIYCFVLSIDEANDDICSLVWHLFFCLFVFVSVVFNPFFYQPSVLPFVINW